MKETFKGKDILVTGGCGCIGSEIVKQLHEFEPKRIRIFDNDEAGHFKIRTELKGSKIIRNLQGDVRDKDRLIEAMKDVDIVFHCAALKHVDLCEYNPSEAIETNVLGTLNAIEAAKERRVSKFITVSTDKAVNPISTMGATKILAEKLTLDANAGEWKTDFVCVRFGNVFNSSGSVMEIWKDQISKGKPVTLTSSEMTRFFMSIEEAVRLILKVADIMSRREIFILKMPSLKIKDLAEVMIEKIGNKNIEIKEIGVKIGERLHETLLTEEESKYTISKEDMFIVKPPIIAPQINNRIDYKIKYKEYSSNNNPLSKEGVRKIVRKWSK